MLANTVDTSMSGEFEIDFLGENFLFMKDVLFNTPSDDGIEEQIGFCRAVYRDYFRVWCGYRLVDRLLKHKPKPNRLRHRHLPRKRHDLPLSFRRLVPVGTQSPLPRRRHSLSDQQRQRPTHQRRRPRPLPDTRCRGQLVVRSRIRRRLHKRESSSRHTQHPRRPRIPSSRHNR
jgi:hypothetical protein